MRSGHIAWAYSTKFDAGDAIYLYVMRESAGSWPAVKRPFRALTAANVRAIAAGWRKARDEVAEYGGKWGGTTFDKKNLVYSVCCSGFEQAD